MVKAILCRELGPPERHELETIEVASPGPGQARIGVRAAGVNFPDLLMLEGKYQFRPELPFIPGIEAAGVVLQTGPGANRFRAGDRVIVRMRNGAFAEQVLVGEEQLLPAPERFSFAEAATFTVAAITAAHALFDRGRLARGETLLVHGAGGGVGLAAVEIGAMIGARVIATCGGEEKGRVVKARGAAHVIDTRQGDFHEKVKALTDGKGADVIYDPVGGRVFEDSLRCIAWGGRLLIVGFADGRIPMLKTNLALLKGCSVIGVRAGEHARQRPEAGANNLRRVLQFAREGRLRPHVSHILPLAKFRDAMQLLAERKAIGRVALAME